MDDMTREQWESWLRDHCGNNATIPPKYREQLADLLKSQEQPRTDYLTPETLRSFREELNPHDRTFLAKMVCRLIARLATPPVVQWTDVGDGAIAAVGRWTLCVRPSHFSDTGYELSVAKNGRGYALCADTKQAAKIVAESKLAELMRVV